MPILPARALLLIAALPLFSSCASVCRQKTFYKPVAAAEYRVATGGTNEVLQIKPTDAVAIAVQDCGLGKGGTTGPIVICLSFRVAEGKRVRLLEPNLLLRDTETNARKVELGQMTYQVQHLRKSDGTWENYSSTASPVTGPLERKEAYRTSRAYADSYSFSSHLEFTGTEDRSNALGARLFSASESWREYRTQAIITDMSADRFEISLPEVHLDGKPLVIPPILFRRVTESVCRTTV